MPLALPGTLGRATARALRNQSRRRRFTVYFFIIHRCASSVGTSIGSESALLPVSLGEHCLLHGADVVVVQEESLVRQFQWFSERCSLPGAHTHGQQRPGRRLDDSRRSESAMRGRRRGVVAQHLESGSSLRRTRRRSRGTCPRTRRSSSRTRSCVACAAFRPSSARGHYLGSRRRRSSARRSS